MQGECAARMTAQDDALRVCSQIMGVCSMQGKARMVRAFGARVDQSRVVQPQLRVWVACATSSDDVIASVAGGDCGGGNAQLAGQVRAAFGLPPFSSSLPSAAVWPYIAAARQAASLAGAPCAISTDTACA